MTNESDYSWTSRLAELQILGEFPKVNAGSPFFQRLISVEIYGPRQEGHRLERS